MTELLPWSQYKKWHELLDAICVHQGHFDNARLADSFCKTIGHKSQSAFEAAQKNIANWRTGRHTPNRGNFLILSKILTVPVYAGLAEQWNALYAAARSKEDDIPETAEAAPGEVAGEPDTKSEGRSGDLRRLFARIAAALLLAMGVSAAYFYWVLPEPFDPYGYHGKEIAWRRTVDLKVGESAIVHGMRGRCGQAAPDWEIVRKGLPELPIGTFSDGGVGLRTSRACGGPTPARAVRFTATKPGQESFRLYDDPITITVE